MFSLLAFPSSFVSVTLPDRKNLWQKNEMYFELIIYWLFSADRLIHHVVYI